MKETVMEEYKLTLYEEDLGFPRELLYKYIRDPQEARNFIMMGGRPLLSEVVIKNWASHYFRRDMEVNSLSNAFGFDIRSTDGEIFIEVKTTWKPDSKYVSFKSIGQKKDEDGNYAFTHIAFYSPLLDPNGVVLFSRKQFEEEVVIPPAGKLNIKMDLNEGYLNNTCHQSSVAFHNNIKWM
jgi:hypothetical protein